MKRLLLLLALLPACATGPRPPEPVPYPMAGVRVYGASWIITDASGLLARTRAHVARGRQLRALGELFRNEKRWLDQIERNHRINEGLQDPDLP